MSDSNVDTLTTGGAAQRLRAAVQTWGAIRLSRLGAAAEQLGALSADPGRSLPGRRVADRLAAWIALASDDDPVDFDLLLRHFPLRNNFDVAWSQLEALARRTPDPRLPEALLRLFDNPVLRDDDIFWTHVFELIRRSADARTADAVQARLARVRTDRRRIRRDIVAALEALAAPIPEPATPIELRDALDALDAWLAQGLDRGPALLAQVFERPDDIGARLVYGDWLMSEGDPRGECIALQAQDPPSREAKRRIKALIKAHGQAWLGPLGPLVGRSGRVFEAGFLSAGTVTLREAAAVEAALDDPHWCTLRRLQLGASGRVEHLVPAVLGQAALAHLRVLEVWGSDAVLAALASRPFANRLHDLSLWQYDLAAVDPALQAHVVAGPGLAGLERLIAPRVDCSPGALDWLLDSALGQRLRVLGLGLEEPTLPAWLARLGDHPIQTLVIGDDVRIEVRKDKAGAWTDVWSSNTHSALRLLEMLPLTGVRSLRFAGTRKEPRTDLHQAELDRVCARWAATLEVLDCPGRASPPPR